MIYERIERSLNKAIKLHNEGATANDSIIKVAQENELNPETISRVVEAFNIAKTKAYVKVAQDKSSDFDIANKKEVIKAVFDTSTQKKSSEMLKFANESGCEYGCTCGEEGYSVKKKDRQDREETVITQTSEVPLEAKIKKAFQAMEEQNRELEEQREEIVEIKEAFYNALKEASELLSYTHERDKAAEYAAQIFYQHSDNPRAGQIMSLICKCAGVPSKELVESLVGAQDYLDTPFISYFDKVVTADSEYTIKAALFNDSLDEVKSKQAQLKKLVYRSGNIDTDKTAADLIWGDSKKVKKVAGFSEFPTDLLNDVLGSLFKTSKQASTKKASNAASSFLKFSNVSDVISQPANVIQSISSASGGGSKSIDDLASKGQILKLQGIKSPKVDQAAKSEMNDMKRELILRELLSDDIIAQQNPHDVAGAYNTMIQLAPNASMIYDIAKSVLRQGTAQVIDPHFANTLVELENNILKTQNFTPGQK